MDNLSIVKIIALITIFVSLLLSLFLLTVKTRNKLSNGLLVSFITFCAIDVIGLFISQYLKLFLFTKTFTFLIFPSFFLYVLSICSIGFRLRFRDLLHTIPFILYNAVLLFYFFSDLYFTKNDLISEPIQQLEWITNSILLKLQALFYVIATISVLRKHKKIYLENYSSGNISIYKLLSQTINIFLITLPVTIAKDILPFTNFNDILKWVNIILITSALFMFCWFILKALYHPKLFRNVDFKIQSTNSIIKHIKPETEQSNNQTLLIEQLKNHMIEQEPYLDPSITLQELSSQLNIPSRELSVLINSHIGQHFFDFVNEYRIEKAMKILKDFPNNKFTIQQVFYDVGFNSKSSFNTAFKKHTNLTPTEFKKKYL